MSKKEKYGKPGLGLLLPNIANLGDLESAKVIRDET